MKSKFELTGTCKGLRNINGTLQKRYAFDISEYYPVKKKTNKNINWSESPEAHFGFKMLEIQQK